MGINVFIKIHEEPTFCLVYLCDYRGGKILSEISYKMLNGKINTCHFQEYNAGYGMNLKERYKVLIEDVKSKPISEIKQLIQTLNLISSPS